MTARESATTPWNADDCKTFLDLLDGFEKGKIFGCVKPHLTSKWRYERTSTFWWWRLQNMVCCPFDMHHPSVVLTRQSLVNHLIPILSSSSQSVCAPLRNVRCAYRSPGCRREVTDRVVRHFGWQFFLLGSSYVCGPTRKCLGWWGGICRGMEIACYLTRCRVVRFQPSGGFWLRTYISNWYPHTTGNCHSIVSGTYWSGCLNFNHLL